MSLTIAAMPTDDEIAKMLLGCKKARRPARRMTALASALGGAAREKHGLHHGAPGFRADGCGQHNRLGRAAAATKARASVTETAAGSRPTGRFLPERSQSF